VVLADAGEILDEQVARASRVISAKLNGLFLAKNGAGNGALELRNVCEVRSALLKTQALPVTT